MPDNPAERVVHAVEMNKTDWENVLKASGVLKAWIGKQTDDRIIVKRARSPAFALKKDGIMPDYEVDDDSHIESRQTSKRIESELSSKGFSEWSVKASLAGGAHGLTLGLSGDIGRRKEMTSTSSQAFEATKIHCSYNFPRVVLTFAKKTLTLSTECAEILESLRKKDAKEITEDELRDFFEQFGGIFAQEVCLGGRLYSVDSLANVSEAQILARKNDMKRAITANFMGPFVGAGIGWSQTRGDENSSTAKSSSGYQGVSIEAHGGNSLLSWSPPQWAVSVENHHYWRAIKVCIAYQDHVPAITKTVQQDRVVKLIPYLSESFLDFTNGGIQYKETIEKLKVAYDKKENAGKEAEESILAVEVGNNFRQLEPYERISSNPARWTFWVSLSRPKMVKLVKITLHHTFTPRNIEFGPGKDQKAVSEKMSITRDGWGTFPIIVEILLVDSWCWRGKEDKPIPNGTPLKKNWELYLDLSKPEGTKSIIEKWKVAPAHIDV